MEYNNRLLILIYKKMWAILLNVCKENHSVIETAVYSKITNIEIKRNAEDLLEHLNPTSVALDHMKKKKKIV